MQDTMSTPDTMMELSTPLDVLNYALTLEHLEYSFYRDGIGLFTFGDDSRGASIDTNLAAIRDHEMAHVDALTKAITDLGGEPVAEATYDFGDAYTDPTAFLATASPKALGTTLVTSPPKQTLAASPKPRSLRKGVGMEKSP